MSDPINQIIVFTGVLCIIDVWFLVRFIRRENAKTKTLVQEMRKFINKQ